MFAYRSLITLWEHIRVEKQCLFSCVRWISLSGFFFSSTPHASVFKNKVFFLFVLGFHIPSSFLSWLFPMSNVTQASVWIGPIKSSFRRCRADCSPRNNRLYFYLLKRCFFQWVFWCRHIRFKDLQFNQRIS